MRLDIPFQRGGVEALPALFEEPASGARANAVLLANGAGLPHDSPFMEATGRGLVARGFRVMRFDYPYQARARTEGRARRPDRTEVLEEAHAAALAALLGCTDGRRPLLAGKSMGGRMSTHLAAKDHACAGLILLGYPLHPPRKPEKLRTEHFPAVAQPALFLQGTRDALCDLDLLREALRRFGGRPTLHVVDDADHGFHVPKRAGRTDAEVLEELLDRVAAWDSETFPE